MYFILIYLVVARKISCHIAISKATLTAALKSIQYVTEEEDCNCDLLSYYFMDEIHTQLRKRTLGLPGSKAVICPAKTSVRIKM